LKTSDFDYHLPPELIAQIPLEPRDQSRLMVLRRSEGSIEHRHFYEVSELLSSNDALVMNNSRVIPARLFGVKADTGAGVELLLLRRDLNGYWEAMVKPGKRLPAGTKVVISSGQDNAIPAVIAEIKAVMDDGIRLISFSDETGLAKLGQMPLPPYIHTRLADRERYQTVYSKNDGSAAAPTAGLHFTYELLDKLKTKGIDCFYTTLHIGLDTFRPVQVEDPTQHRIHREYGVIDIETAAGISKARATGKRIVCVGTTSVRILEHAAGESQDAILGPFEGWVDTFILPGHRFNLTGAMLTNFHLPCSTLLMLVSAFAGQELIRKAYSEAIKEQYRFYSFGDAMLIL
jgi:S-adenosylmethionine:tRNA ribosyltransferase-isomerase